MPGPFLRSRLMRLVMESKTLATSFFDRPVSLEMSAKICDLVRGLVSVVEDALVFMPLFLAIVSPFSLGSDSLWRSGRRQRRSAAGRRGFIGRLPSIPSGN